MKRTSWKIFLALFFTVFKMEEDLPTEYDAIVLGTGLPESVVAAALARVGQKVLHLDRNDYYSSEWTTFTFDGLLKWIEENQTTTATSEDTTSSSDKDAAVDDKEVFPLPKHSNAISNLVTQFYFRKKGKEDTSKSEETPANENESNQNETKDQSTDQHTSPQQDKSEEKSEGIGDQVNIEEQALETVSQTTQTNSQQETTDSSTFPSIADDSITQNVISEDSRESPEEAHPAPGEIQEESQSSQIPKIFRRGPAPKPPVNKDMTYEDFEQYFRQFNIDLAPKMLFARGPLVEAIISANISHYAEFKCVNRILTYLNGNIEDVPCSRSDVFSSKLISAIEKRTLMKFLTFCIDYENHEGEYQEFIDKPYVEFLKSRRLTPNLQHFVLHAIAMVTSTTSTVPGLKATKSFLQSLGRYGNAPFIWPIYGIGELPQAFCRMCAVFGGLYCLRKNADSIVVDPSDNTCTGVVMERQLLKCRWLIVEHTYLPDTWKKETTRFVSRAVFITDKSVKSSDKGNVTLLAMPRANGDGGPIKIYELDNTTAASPRGLFVVHFVTESHGPAQEDLQGTAEELLHFPTNDDDRDSSKPVVLWSMFFNHAASDQTHVQDTLPSNIKATVMPGATLGFSQAMQQAKKIFQSICGTDEEFLPAIPNPEDIIMDDLNATEEPGNNTGIGTIPSDGDNADSSGGDSNPTHNTSDRVTAEGVSVHSVSSTDSDMNTSGALSVSVAATSEGMNDESVSKDNVDENTSGLGADKGEVRITNAEFPNIAASDKITGYHNENSQSNN